LPTTRALAVVVIPFLVVACAMLYVWPNDSGRLFAWPIKPAMSAMLLASAYAGGIYYFARVALSKRWHTIKDGFLPVATFATLLGIATLVHWDRFTHNSVSFWAWAGLYFTTPFLVLGAWLLNRQADPGVPEPGERPIAPAARCILCAVGAMSLGLALLLFLQPGLLIAIWPWKLTPLTARVVGAMFALPGVLAFEMVVDPRWSAARVMVQALVVSFSLMIIAMLRARADFDWAHPAAWIVAGGLVAMYAGGLVLYVLMESRSRA